MMCFILTFFVRSVFIVWLSYKDGIYAYDSELHPKYNPPFGSWKHIETCPPNKFAASFKIKVRHGNSWYIDDVGMTGMTLQCYDPEKRETPTDITSSYTSKGGWQNIHNCPLDSWLKGYQLRIMKYHGVIKGKFIDDTAVNDIRMICSNSPNPTTLNGGGAKWGSWQDWLKCPDGQAVCGLQSRTDDPSSWASIGKVGLSNLRLFCCKHPMLKNEVKSTTTTESQYVQDTTEKPFIKVGDASGSAGSGSGSGTRPETQSDTKSGADFESESDTKDQSRNGNDTGTETKSGTNLGGGSGLSGRSNLGEEWGVESDAEDDDIKNLINGTLIKSFQVHQHDITKTGGISCSIYAALAIPYETSADCNGFVAFLATLTIAIVLIGALMLIFLLSKALYSKICVYNSTPLYNIPTDPSNNRIGYSQFASLVEREFIKSSKVKKGLFYDKTKKIYPVISFDKQTEQPVFTINSIKKDKGNIGMPFVD